MRVDKWLWAARFFKTRSLAQQAIEKGRVKLGGQTIKPARDIKVGDRLLIEQADCKRAFDVLALSDRRGPAVEAQTLYRETESSIAATVLARERRQQFPEPAHSILQGRPTKQQRRALNKFVESGHQAD